MKDKDSHKIFEAFEGGVRLHKPTGEWERLVDYLIQKGHGEVEAKQLANGFLKHRKDVKPEDQVQEIPKKEAIGFPDEGGDRWPDGSKMEPERARHLDSLRNRDAQRDKKAEVAAKVKKKKGDAVVSFRHNKTCDGQLSPVVIH